MIRELDRLKSRTEQTNTKLQYKQQMKKKLGISFCKVLVKDHLQNLSCEMMSAIVLIFNAAWLSLSV